MTESPPPADSDGTPPTDPTGDASATPRPDGSDPAPGSDPDSPAAQRNPDTTDEPGGCRGPGGRSDTVPATDAAVVTGRAPVRTDGTDPDGADHDAGTTEHAAPEPGGWRRHLPRRPWRWLGGLAALAALGSLALGAAYVWLTRVPGRAPSDGTSHTPGTHDPTPGPSGAPHGSPDGGTPWPTDAPHGTSPSNGSCSVEGVSCDPVGSACNNACDDMASSCGGIDVCGSQDPCGDQSCNSSGGDCGSTLHTLWAPIATLGTPPYLHRTAHGPGPAYPGPRIAVTPPLAYAGTAPLAHAGTAPLARADSRADTRTGGPTVPARVGIAAIRAYQRISPTLPTRCRYTPTCSRYGLAAIQRYGLLAGAQVAVARIRRCTVHVTPGTPDPLPAETPGPLPA
ncbi:MAG TPA: membrane protein insertion efficiency factor YidD [Actinocatenispora sp.]